jgi:dTDP-4-amino-4,6-dideoxygalactose transaminase
VIPINLPKIGEEEVQAVIKVMRSGYLTSGLGQGPVVSEFEAKFAKFADAKHAIAVNTGTAALHAAIAAMGVKAGDEVILPSFTFVATAEAVVLAGGKPVFADIDPETYNLDPEPVAKAVTKKTKVIVPVDLYGLSADMEPIREVAKKYGCKIVEDAAQAHGLSYLGKQPGAYADAACWSLYASKNMTTGEGGVVTTNDDHIAEVVRMVRTHGERAKYASEMLGNNYRMTEMEAAIGVEQLKKLPSFVAKRRENALHLTEILSKSDKLCLPHEFEGDVHSWYLYTARLYHGEEAKRDKLLDDLHKAGIGAEAYYIHPVHTMPYYRNTFGAITLPVTEEAAKQVFSLPIHPGVTAEQVEFIGKTVLSLL